MVWFMCGADFTSNFRVYMHLSKLASVDTYFSLSQNKLFEFIVLAFKVARHSDAARDGNDSKFRLKLNIEKACGVEVAVTSF